MSRCLRRAAVACWRWRLEGPAADGKVASGEGGLSEWSATVDVEEGATNVWAGRRGVEDNGARRSSSRGSLRTASGGVGGRLVERCKWKTGDMEGATLARGGGGAAMGRAAGCAKGGARLCRGWLGGACTPDFEVAVAECRTVNSAAEVARALVGGGGSCERGVDVEVGVPTTWRWSPARRAGSRVAARCG